MSWFTEHRLHWIDECLRVYGFINRIHLIRKFGISAPQASTDLQEFQKRFPGLMTYDPSAKRYVLKDHAPEALKLKVVR